MPQAMPVGLVMRLLMDDSFQPGPRPTHIADTDGSRWIFKVPAVISKWKYRPPPSGRRLAAVLIQNRIHRRRRWHPIVLAWPSGVRGPTRGSTAVEFAGGETSRTAGAGDKSSNLSLHLNVRPGARYVPVLKAHTKLFTCVPCRTVVRRRYGKIVPPGGAAVGQSNASPASNPTLYIAKPPARSARCLLADGDMGWDGHRISRN